MQREARLKDRVHEPLSLGICACQSKPTDLHHKATGQARGRVNGNDHYLGLYGLPLSREKYDELIDE